MASSDARTAADAVLMTIAVLQAGGQSLSPVVASCYSELAEKQTMRETSEVAGLALVGHIELTLLLLNRLSELTGLQPDRLLRDALA